LAGTSTNNLTFAIDGITFNPGGVGVQGNYAVNTAGGGGGVHGLTSSTSGFSYGVSGDATGATGTAIGVVGTSFSDQGIGVLGNRPNAAASGFGGGGVRGVTSADNFVFTYGTAGVATAATGGAVGVFGQTYSPNGTAGLFANVAGGNILEGGFGQPETTVFRVDGTGRVFADGGFQPNGADFAESMSVTGIAQSTQRETCS
jgi:trimeric autotransporter adhesin